MTADGLFAAAEELPDDRARERFEQLVGIDDIKQQLVAEAHALLDPQIVETWSTKAHGTVIPAARDVVNRTALVILAGDVGTGKTELAETVGDQLARDAGVKVTLFPLSLAARGHGAVGEMTTLLTRAFEKVKEQATGGRGKDGRLRHATILLVDEADALAQSRELSQMHHEDRAGVNALIRGIDGLRNNHLPVLTIMCTNRMDAIDPAVRRRAAAIFEFTRPDDGAREQLLRRALEGVTIGDNDMKEIVRLTGPQNGRAWGCTYSDLRQRLIPAAVLEALERNGPITGETLISFATTFVPTRPFDSQMAGTA
ncbi:MAG: AAA family ATPase [Acidimicrobiales bacterium]